MKVIFSGAVRSIFAVGLVSTVTQAWPGRSPAT